MLKDVLFNREALPWIRRGIDVSEARRRGGAENIANSLTPGYRARRVAFEELLGGEKATLRLTRSQDGHQGADASGPTHRTVEADEPILPNGVNNIDIENEMASMAWNRVQMTALARFATKQYSLLSRAIGNSRT